MRKHPLVDTARRIAPRLDTRGASTTLSYVLTLSITAILISGLLIATGAVLDDRRESVTRDELGVVGQQLSARLMAADRLASTSPTEVVVRGQFPERVAGSAYRVSVNNSSQPFLHLEAPNAGVSVRIPFAVRTPVVETRVAGGDLRVVLNAAGELEVQSQ